MGIEELRTAAAERVARRAGWLGRGIPQMAGGDPLTELREAYQAACQRVQAAADAIDQAADDADVEPLQTEMDEAVAEAERTQQALRRAEARQAARRDHVPAGTDDQRQAGDVRVNGESELVYRRGGRSFFADLLAAERGSQAARERLEQHRQQVVAHRRAEGLPDPEQRDVTTADPGAAGFLPPIYMGQLYAELPRPGRPFADVLPQMALPPVGLVITIPKVQSGVTVASQNGENTAVSETDIDTQTISVPVRVVAGLNDISLQAYERTSPGMDQIIFNDLQRAYDAELDRQLIRGTGTNGEHLGIRAVSGVNTSSYTDGSPTAAEALPKLYDGIQKIETNRFMPADTIVMHPRRSAWFASQLSSTFPLFQQGQLYQAVGTQQQGMVASFAGLTSVRDPNVPTLGGAGTNEDEIYVLFREDLVLMEDDLRFETFRDVGSAGLTVRLRAYAYSAFVSARQPTAITVISGTGLTAPTF